MATSDAPEAHILVHLSCNPVFAACALEQCQDAGAPASALSAGFVEQWWDALAAVVQPRLESNTTVPDPDPKPDCLP